MTLITTVNKNIYVTFVYVISKLYKYCHSVVASSAHRIKMTCSASNHYRSSPAGPSVLRSQRWPAKQLVTKCKSILCISLSTFRTHLFWLGNARLSKQLQHNTLADCLAPLVYINRCGKIGFLPDGLCHTGIKVSGTNLCVNINRWHRLLLIQTCFEG